VPENRNVGQDMQAEIIKTFRRSQEAVVGALRTWSDTVRSAAPQLSELSLPFADKLPKPHEVAARLPKPDQLAAKLPRPEQLAGNAYDLIGKLMAAQRKLAETVLHTTAPMLPGKSDTTGKKNGPAAK
jgi:hypothetical protein